MTDEERRDLDETRRLLYAALAASRTERYNLVGTIVNALRHHQGMLLDRTIEQTLNAVIAVCVGDSEARVEARELIEEITAKLDAPVVTAAPELPPEITNALAALDELVMVISTGRAHTFGFMVDIPMRAFNNARITRDVAKRYVDRAGS